MDLNTIVEVIERPTRGMLAERRNGDAWLGGGTWLYSEPQPELRRLFDLTGFGWPALLMDPDGLVIAATCRMAELERWTPPPAWSAAALLIPLCCRALLGSFKVWNGATVGGNLCLALPAGPMTALAVAFEGECEIWGAVTDRRLAAADFVLGNGRNALEPGEILRAIHLPAERPGTRAAFRQMSLTPLGRSAALLIGILSPDGAFALTITAATVRPLRLAFPAPPSRAELEARIDAAASCLWFDDVHGRPAWRRHVTLHLAGAILSELGGEVWE